jgi:hypothetical protein
VQSLSDSMAVFARVENVVARQEVSGRAFHHGLTLEPGLGESSLGEAFVEVGTLELLLHPTVLAAAERSKDHSCDMSVSALIKFQDIVFKSRLESLLVTSRPRSHGELLTWKFSSRDKTRNKTHPWRTSNGDGGKLLESNWKFLFGSSKPLGFGTLPFSPELGEFLSTGEI